MQLKRGLALLRAALPRGLAVPAALVLGHARGLAAVRAEVLAAISLAPGVAAGFAFGGALLMTKFLLLGVVACAVAGSVWLWVRGGAASTSVSLVDAAVPAAAVEPRQPRSRPALATPRRSEVPPAPTSPPDAGDAFDSSPVLVPPYDFRVHVVDEQGRPVADAEVAAHDAIRVRPDPDARGNSYSGLRKDAPPVVMRRTDEQGLAVLPLDRECVYFRAAKDDVGRTGWMYHWHTGKPEVVTLRADVRLEGSVLRPDGSPAAGVSVHAEPSGSNLLHVLRPDPPPPALTDGAGRFRLRLAAMASYELHARDGELRTQTQEWFARPGEANVVLRFPGGITIRGRLLDPEQRPTTGRVKIWELVSREERATGQPQFLAEKEVRDGEFTFELPRFGRYQVIGSAPRLPPTELTVVQLDATQRHATLDLLLPRPAAIAGRVLDAHGTPMTGAEVTALSAGERHSYLDRPSADDLHGKARQTTTAADGTFTITGLHPHVPHHVLCRPDPKRRHIYALRADVPPGTSDLLFGIGDDLLAGATIDLRVVDGRTNAAVAEYRYEVARQLPTWSSSWAVADPVPVHDATGRCTIRDLNLDQEHRLRVQANGFADEVLFVRTHAGNTSVTVTLQPAATLRFVGREADGSPAVGAAAIVQRLDSPRVPCARLPPATDADGRATVTDLPPGRYRVWLARGERESKRREIELRPGEEAEQEFRLPPR